MTLTLGHGLLRGALWDVSASGARLLFHQEDYLACREALAEALRSGRHLKLEIESGEGPIGVFIVWYGVTAEEGFAVGVETATARPIPPLNARPPGASLKLVSVHHRRSRQARLALSLRDLFLAIGDQEFSLDAALALLCEKVRSLTRAEGVTFWALGDGEPILRAQAGRWTFPFGSRLPQGGEMFIPPFPVLKRALQRGRQLFANEASTSIFATHPGVVDLGLRSIMLIPVFGREVDFGMLVFGHSRDPYAFGPAEQTEAEIFANQAALFFEKAQLLEDYRESASFLATMNRIALAFHERLDVDEVLQVICRESRALFGVDLTTMFLREGDGYVQRAADGMKMTAERIDRWEVTGPEAGMVGRGEAFYLNDFESTPIADRPAIRRYMGSRAVRSIMVIPIRDRSEVLGTLTFADRSSSRRFSAEDLEMGKLLGEQAARALINTRLYEHLAQSKQVLRQQDRFRVLGELASVVSHEIKNALVPLRTMVELLPERYDDPDFRDWYSRTVAQEVDRMHGLVTQLARFRSAEKSAPQPTDPVALVNGVVDLLRPEARARQIAIEVEAESVGPITAAGDELRQVLINLILNAIQAVESRGTVRVGVCRPVNEAGILFWVADSGPGIAPGEIDRIFDPLFTTKENGSGLGLAIARDLVVGQGGSIRVESEPGRGATFRILLPEVREQARRTPLVH